MSKVRMIAHTELQKTWEESVGAYFKLLSRYFPGETEEKIENTQSE
jgi:hypothetical protein